MSTNHEAHLVSGSGHGLTNLLHGDPVLGVEVVHLERHVLDVKTLGKQYVKAAAHRMALSLARLVTGYEDVRG